jgi:hypothetical protein
MKKNKFMETMMNTPRPTSLFFQEESIKKNIIILDVLKKWIPPLTADEREQLEQNIIQFGCKDPLIIWETTTKIVTPDSPTEGVSYVLLDGHNRYEICTKYSLDFKITLVELRSMQDAQDFMIDHQLGRRNLSAEQMAYLRGMKYLSLKQNRGKYDRTESDINHSGHSDHYEKNALDKTAKDHSGHSDHYEKNALNKTAKDHSGHSDHYEKNALDKTAKDHSGHSDHYEKNALNKTTKDHSGHSDHYEKNALNKTTKDHSGHSDHYEKNALDKTAKDHSGHSDHYEKKERLSEQLATEFNVGEKTIRRDADFARGVELLPKDIKKEVLQGKSPLSKKAIIVLGRTQDSDEIIDKVAELLSPKTTTEEGIKAEELKSKAKEKVIATVKAYLSEPEECDELLKVIRQRKKELLKEKK